MDILIKGIELPKEIQCCYTIFPNGKVIVHWDGKVLGEAEAIEVPPHGRLVDLDLVEELMRKKHKDNDCPFDIDAFLFALRKMPTVLEATISND